MFRALATNALRVVIWVVLRAVYRVRVEGAERIPAEGPALLISNHVSYLDAVIIAAHTARPINFVMYWRLYKALRWIVAPLGALPIASKAENRAIYDAAMARIEELLVAGEVVCFFPEGKLTLDGQMNEFRPGVLKILDKVPVPVIPIALTGLWGSWFSHKGKRGFAKWPRHWGASIGMRVGSPLEATASLDKMRSVVVALAA